MTTDLCKSQGKKMNGYDQPWLAFQMKGANKSRSLTQLLNPSLCLWAVATFVAVEVPYLTCSMLCLWRAPYEVLFSIAA